MTSRPAASERTGAVQHGTADSPLRAALVKLDRGALIAQHIACELCVSFVGFLAGGFPPLSAAALRHPAHAGPVPQCFYPPV